MDCVDVQSGKWGWKPAEAACCKLWLHYVGPDVI